VGFSIEFWNFEILHIGIASDISRVLDLKALGNTHSVDASMLESATKSRHNRKYAYRFLTAPIIPKF
jgi:hypothetical protein